MKGMGKFVVILTFLLFLGLLYILPSQLPSIRKTCNQLSFVVIKVNLVAYQGMT